MRLRIEAMLADILRKAGDQIWAAEKEDYAANCLPPYSVNNRPMSK